jgi:hypothetical protein
MAGHHEGGAQVDLPRCARQPGLRRVSSGRNSPSAGRQVQPRRHPSRQFPGLVVATLGQALRCQGIGSTHRAGQPAAADRTQPGARPAQASSGRAVVLELAHQAVPGKAVVHRADRVLEGRRFVQAGAAAPARPCPGAGRSGTAGTGAANGPRSPCTGRGPGTTAGRARTGRARPACGWLGAWLWPGVTSDQYTARPMATPPQRPSPKAAGCGGAGACRAAFAGFFRAALAARRSRAPHGRTPGGHQAAARAGARLGQLPGCQPGRAGCGLSAGATDRWLNPMRPRPTAGASQALVVAAPLGPTPQVAEAGRRAADAAPNCCGPTCNCMAVPNPRPC